MNIVQKLKLGLKLKALSNWATSQNWKEAFKMPEVPAVANGVPVKPAIKAKIAWGGGVLLVLGAASYFGVQTSPEQQQQAATGVQAIMDWVTTDAIPFAKNIALPALIVVWRIFFNRTVTPEVK